MELKVGMSYCANNGSLHKIVTKTGNVYTDQAGRWYQENGKIWEGHALGTSLDLTET